MMRWNVLAPLIIALGCQASIDQGTNVNQTSQQVLARNGMSLNGRYLNGRYLNGVYLNGRYLNGRYLNGIYLNGRYLNGVSLNGTALSGDGFSGADFEGATAEVELASGEVTQIRFDKVQLDRQADMYYHTVSIATGSEEVCSGRGKNYSCETATVWAPICGDADGAPVESILLAGRWSDPGNGGDGSKIDDPDSITIACRGAALAKCAEMGYRPWDGLADHHQACTRMIRADYCGTGVSHTVDGWLVNIYDLSGIQASDTSGSANLEFEAEWGTDGATCLNQRRTKTQNLWYTTFDGADLDCEVPTSATCGDLSIPEDGSLIYNESEVLGSGDGGGCNGTCEPSNDLGMCMCPSDCPGQFCF